MALADLVRYVQNQRANRASDEVIQKSLLAAGWKETDVAAALAAPQATSGGSSTVSVSGILSAEDQRFKSRRVWLAFLVLVVLYIVTFEQALFVVNINEVLDKATVIALIVNIVFCYIFAWTSMLGLVPRDSKIFSWFEVIVRIGIAATFGYMLAPLVIFAVAILLIGA